MQTVFKVASVYCQSHELPAPSQNDLVNLGRIISFHFRKEMTLDHPPMVPVANCGFLCEPHPNGQIYTVCFYGDPYRTRMEDLTAEYYRTKSARIEASVQKRTERPRRRTTTRTPAFSGKKFPQ